MTTRRSTKPSRPWPREPGGYLIAADAGLGSVPLEVRVTRRWRELDSNFRFRARVVSVLLLRDQMLVSSSYAASRAKPLSTASHFREPADNDNCAGRGATCAAHIITQPDDGHRPPLGRTQKRHHGHRSNGYLRRMAMPHCGAVSCNRRATRDDRTAGRNASRSSHSARPQGRRWPASHC